MTFVIKNLEVSLGNIKEKNFNLERRYNWPEGQISNKIGIKQRHISNANQNTTTLAKTAVKKILKKNNLSKVKFIISVTNTPTRVFPSLAHEISSLISKSKNFMCMGINYSLACMNRYESYYLHLQREGEIAEAKMSIEGEIAEAKSSIERILHRYCQLAETIADPERFFIRFVECVLAQKLVDDGLSDDVRSAVSCLDRLKNWSGMELEPIDLITMTTIPTQSSADFLFVFQHEMPLPPTEKLFQEYDKTGLLWLTAMSLDSRLVWQHIYKEKMKSSPRMIPSQLRTNGPVGPKNAYTHVCSIYGSNGEKHHEIRFIHHGSHAALTPVRDAASDSETARLSIQSVQDRIQGPQDTLHLDFILNSRWSDIILTWSRRLCCRSTGGLLDKRIVDSTKAAAASLRAPMRRPPSAVQTDSSPLLSPSATTDFRGGFMSADLGINGMRRLDGLGIDRQTRDALRSVIEATFSSIQEYLSVSAERDALSSEIVRQLKSLRNKLSQRNDSLFSDRLKRWRCCSSRDRFDHDLNAIGVISDIVQVGAIMDQVRDCLKPTAGESGAAPAPVSAIPSLLIWFGCASGENRTGIVLYSLVHQENHSSGHIYEPILFYYCHSVHSHLICSHIIYHHFLWSATDYPMFFVKTEYSKHRYFYTLPNSEYHHNYVVQH